MSDAYTSALDFAVAEGLLQPLSAAELDSLLTAIRIKPARPAFRSVSDGKGGKRIGTITAMSMPDLKDWLRSKETTEPMADRKAYQTGGAVAPDPWAAFEDVPDTAAPAAAAAPDPWAAFEDVEAPAEHVKWWEAAPLADPPEPCRYRQIDGHRPCTSRHRAAWATRDGRRVAEPGRRLGCGKGDCRTGSGKIQAQSDSRGHQFGRIEPRAR